MIELSSLFLCQSIRSKKVISLGLFISSQEEIKKRIATSTPIKDVRDFE
jgi:hypothetical protein